MCNIFGSFGGILKMLFVCCVGESLLEILRGFLCYVGGSIGGIVKRKFLCDVWGNLGGIVKRICV